MLGKSRIAAFFQWFAGPDVQHRNEKWHAAVARSTFVSQNAQNTTFAEQFLKFRCPKLARRCGAKHICNFWSSDVQKSHAAVARSAFVIFEVQMSKNRTPLWREANSQVKMHKTSRGRTDFRGCNLEKWHAVVARSTFASQNVQKLQGSDHVLKLRCRKIIQSVS